MKHDLDEDDIDALDELGEISGSEQQQYCYVWCRTHKKYEWHWLWRPRKKRKK